MKRLVTAICLLTLIIAISCCSLFILEQDLDELTTLAVQLRDSSPEEELEQKSQELLECWNRKEQLLVIFVRHDILDELTTLTAQLPSLARYRDYAHFYSGLDVILARLDDLLDSARPTYRNLL